MRVCLRIAAVVSLLALAARPSASEPLGSHFEFTQFGGYTMFGNDRNQLTGRPLKNALYLGGRFGYHFPNWIGLEGEVGFSPAKEDVPSGAELDFWHVSGNVMLRPYRAHWGWPYVFGGVGVSELRESGGGRQDKQGNAEAGGGLQLWLNDAIGLRLEARDIMWMGRKDIGKVLSNDWVYGLGLTFALGARPRDTDGDGVPDRRDVCPATPHGALVDGKGCPLDTDGDGVYDGLDKCPGTTKGCKVDATGCPIDSDGDGVCDGLDQCPDTPKGAKVDDKGCPIDSDADGIYDGLDQCPNTLKGCKVDATGCPIDSDGDGVCDGLDQCPGTGKNLKVDANGCPIEITEKETELLDTGMIRLQNVQFETGKANLKPESLPSLDIVGHVLTKWPQLKIEIGGHTDSRGSKKLNQKLSEARVDSVLAYLLKAFPELKADQFVTKGYGSSKPIVPNVSPEAMAINRRVEFVVLNKEVLSREIERRKLLEKSEPSTPPANAPGGAPPPVTPETAPPPAKSGAPADTTRATPPGK